MSNNSLTNGSCAGKSDFRGLYESPRLPDEFEAIRKEIPPTAGDYYQLALDAFGVAKNLHHEAQLSGDKSKARELKKEVDLAEYRVHRVREKLASDFALMVRCVGFTGRDIETVIAPFVAHLAKPVADEIAFSNRSHESLLDELRELSKTDRAALAKIIFEAIADDMKPLALKVMKHERQLAGRRS